MIGERVALRTGKKQNLKSKHRDASVRLRSGGGKMQDLTPFLKVAMVLKTAW